MAQKTTHRGSLARLTETNLPVLSTCLLLLIQFQTFHALPTSSSSLSTGSHQQNTEVIRDASLPSTVYGSAYPYSSYRPGPRLDDSYRPYAPYYPKDPVSSSSATSGLYDPESLGHPNSVYSRQSSALVNSLSQNIDKVLKLIEKEIGASDLEQADKKNSAFSVTNDNQDISTPAQKHTLSLPLATNNNNNNTPIRNNKPRRLPLPSIPSSSSSATYETNNNNKEPQQQQHQNFNDKQQQSATTFGSSSAPEVQQARVADFSPVPPPFAPELDPQYERRQYGLGALTLLDQAGPFW